MFRPMIHAPMLLKPRAAKSSSVVIVPPSWPNIRRKVRVAKANSSSATPPTPRGSARSWLGPAPQPSTDIAVLWTRSLGIRSPISTDVYHRTYDAVWRQFQRNGELILRCFVLGKVGIVGTGLGFLTRANVVSAPQQSVSSSSAKYLVGGAPRQERAFSPALITRGGRIIWFAGQTTTAELNGNHFWANARVKRRRISQCGIAT